MTDTPPTADSSTEPTFAELGLAEPVLAALAAVGYEQPTPIQARTIPPLLDGRDLLGQAQTGTGKTAAFALPLLSRIDVNSHVPQVLVLAPTRELAIQVAEAFQRYAAKLTGLHVLPIYGGQDYGVQLRMLARGVHVIVGTPGRVMDHMRRGTLDLSALQAVVLDEADEMLRMGFIDAVEWILAQTPPKRQLALFSATLPAEIQRIASRHLDKPVEIRLESRTRSAASVRQRVWLVAGTHKLDALTRILEVEPFDAMIVFVRTRNATVELAERLRARGFDADGISGDMQQRQRERIIADLKSGALDILVATDVAARGLDVDRVSHVINFDIPYDTEAYVHRIGRTGRAGRTGDAILFAAPRERNMLRSIERATGQVIELMELPSYEAIKDVRVTRFFETLSHTLAEQDLEELVGLVERYHREHAVDPLLMAAALAYQTKSGAQLAAKRRVSAAPEPHMEPRGDDRRERPTTASQTRATRTRADAPGDSRAKPERKPRARIPGDADTDAADLEVFRIEVGRTHGVEPRNILGAIANEAGIDARNIGRIELFEDYSTVELPTGMPKPVFDHLRRVWVSGQQLKLTRVAPQSRSSEAPARGKAPRPAPRDKPTHKAPAGATRPKTAPRSNRDRPELPAPGDRTATRKPKPRRPEK